MTDLRILVNSELQRIKKASLAYNGGLIGHMDISQLEPIMNEVSYLYPVNGNVSRAQNATPVEEGIRLEREITGAGLIYPITIASVYQTNDPSSLTPLSKPLYQELTLKRPDGTFMSYTNSCKEGIGTLTSNGNAPIILEPTQAVKSIIKEARELKMRPRETPASPAVLTPAN